MIKKKLITVLTIASVFVASVMPVTAASPSTGNNSGDTGVTTEVTNSGADTATLAGNMTADGGNLYNVSAVDQGTKDSIVSVIQALLFKDINAVGNALGNSALAAAKSSGQKVTAYVAALGNVTPDQATKDADGFYTVTLKVNGIKAGDTVAVLHKAGDNWETIMPSNVGNGTVTFKTKSLSPIAVIKLSLTGAVSAPQTGSDMFAVYVIALMGVAGVAYCGKKYLSK